MKKYLKLVLCFFIFVASLVADLITKNIFDNKHITLIKGVFNISSAHNTGAGFSMFSDKVVFLLIVTVIFLIAFTLFNIFDKDEKTNLWWVSIALIYSGAIGNMVDRIMLGYVRDFLYFELINFPVFNIADMCLTVGVALFAFNFLVVFPKLKKQKEENNAV